MSSPDAPQGDNRIAAAHAFARSLNILLRYVRLYGAHHELTGRLVGEQMRQPAQAMMPAPAGSA